MEGEFLGHTTSLWGQRHEDQEAGGKRCMTLMLEFVRLGATNLFLLSR
ncbi:hypothetical protein FHS27_000452 [Rhodopirellula rubra]|uniref:Uncharacterized protein n=1 Tax=Aporhodopirellula rubra TaxID=980271 RepID=A0A7W5DV82_9BACT|nr:hypothetical protein [Aporhodopirellula rubra]